jgi:hypothetical protein
VFFRFSLGMASVHILENGLPKIMVLEIMARQNALESGGMSRAINT